MSARHLLSLAAAVLAVLCAGAVVAAPSARADASACASTTSSSTLLAPSAGIPCWTDVTPYPFGSDGNQVDPTSPNCVLQPNPFGANWGGDFTSPSPIQGPPCYLQLTSMAFRAWNRALAAATFAGSGFSGNNAFGVWLYNGTDWFPDPTFPGSSECPGSTVLWAGKLDYWLIGRPSNVHSTSEQTLCRFDGVNLVWEPLKLPAATLAKLSVAAGSGTPTGGITAGACYAWNDCWFFGDDGIIVHWDGQTLSDASGGLATNPWQQGDFTSAVAGTDPAGNNFGLAVARSTFFGSAGATPLPAQPDGSSPPQLFASQGGAFTPLAFAPPSTPQTGDPFTTDLVDVAADPQGDAWVASGPSRAAGNKSHLAPLLRLTENGAAAPCAGYDASSYDASTFSSSTYTWTGLSVFPGDGSALAGATYAGSFGSEPALVHGVCGQSLTLTRFQIPDPYGTGAEVPADAGGSVTSVAANAANDAWAATTFGQLRTPNPFDPNPKLTRPHLYHWTDGQPPAAPAGDDVESRPSIFTLDPPTYVPAPPVVVIVTPPPTTRIKPGKPRKINEKAAIYSVKTKLPPARGGKLTLYVTFKVRRSVTIGVEALRGRKVVASSGLKHFGGHSGTLTLVLDPHRWPTGLKFVFPKATKKHA